MQNQSIKFPVSRSLHPFDSFSKFQPSLVACDCFSKSESQRQHRFVCLIPFFKFSTSTRCARLLLYVWVSTSASLRPLDFFFWNLKFQPPHHLHSLRVTSFLSLSLTSASLRVVRFVWSDQASVSVGNPHMWVACVTQNPKSHNGHGHGWFIKILKFQTDMYELHSPV